MIKRTIYFGNPVYLSTRNNQLVIQYPEKEGGDIMVPIEDIGFVVIDNPQISMSATLHIRLIENKVAIVYCDERHIPISLAQPLVGHSEQTERYLNQIAMSQPLKKNLWKQVVQQKINNEAILLEAVGRDSRKMREIFAKVQSGDSSNQEAIAAAYYWGRIFPEDLDFYRDRYGPWPNNLLNYGYAILRAIVARAVVSSGMIPSLGIHHKSKYNPFCLADDLMEPYRVYVDEIVLGMVFDMEMDKVMTPEMKRQFLQLPAIDVKIEGKLKPLMNAVTQTSASLYQCITGEKRNLSLPDYEPSEDNK